MGSLSSNAAPAGPLTGLRVLDLTRVLAGPYCTMLLGDLGAEVIKIERPGRGDDTRHWGPPFSAGESAYFLCCNRNKKSVTVDLGSEAGADITRRLASRCDVLVENFLPGKLAEFGLGYDDLRPDNEGLVYCSITGFGQTGPRRLEPGYDLLIQALSGIMSITGEPGGQPMKVGVAIADVTAGLFASNAILAALLARSGTGRGEYIDIGLMDACVAWLANVGSSFLLTGEIPERHGNAHPSIVPYQAFEARDAWFIIAVGNDRQFQRLCEALGRPDLAADVRFQTNADRVINRESLVSILSAFLRQADVSHWLGKLNAAGVPCGPVNSLDEVFSDPQVEARGMRIGIDHPLCGAVSMVASPIKMDSMRPTDRMLAPPALGQHTGEVLKARLGLEEEQLAALSERGVI